jgi:Fic family protein
VDSQERAQGTVVSVTIVHSMTDLNSADYPFQMEVVSFLTLFQYNLVRIHPFADGNGRVARLLTALLCMRAGLPPLIISAEVREQYISVLACAHKCLRASARRHGGVAHRDT